MRQKRKSALIKVGLLKASRETRKMKYFSPEKINENQILQRLLYAKDDNNIINPILSAIYYCDINFAGDLLLQYLSNSNGELKLRLSRLVATFLQKNNTNYHACLFLNQLKKDDESISQYKLEIESLIDEIKWFSKIYK